MVITPRLIPNASSMTLASGARQLVVQEALETIRCSAVSRSSLTPITTMASISSLGGTVSTTFAAPAARCFCRCSRWRKTPDDSTTTSTSSFFQGSCTGSRSAVISTRLPSTYITSSSISTDFENFPITVSNRSR